MCFSFVQTIAIVKLGQELVGTIVFQLFLKSKCRLKKIKRCLVGIFGREASAQLFFQLFHFLVQAR